ncbi:MAG: hypothetical protein R3E90_01670 [Marinicella sp.]|nr:hypothetical protein [Xanthomonadales bacterium]
MKTIIVIILILLLSFSSAAQDAVSLNDAVKQAEKEGRVISARTVNEKHEVKVLTASGTVKTLNINAGGSTKKIKPPKPEYYNRGGSSVQNNKHKPVIPQRYKDNKRQQRTIRLDRRKLDSQPATRNRNGSKNDSRKDK